MSTKTAFVVQHDEFCPAGMIGEIATERGYELVDIKSYVGEVHDLPDPAEADIILVTGSTAHWYDLPSEPQLQRELAFLRAAVDAEVPVFGMCFGGQGLAMALGAEVTPAPHFEAGWMRLDTADPSVVPPGPWFEMHHDQFTLPSGAELLAWNDLCPQAFRYGPHLALQFHPEVDLAMLAPWEPSLASYEGLDVPGLLRQTAEHEAGARLRAAGLFDTFLSWGSASWEPAS